MGLLTLSQKVTFTEQFQVGMGRMNWKKEKEKNKKTGWEKKTKNELNSLKLDRSGCVKKCGNST